MCAVTQGRRPRPQHGGSDMSSKPYFSRSHRRACGPRRCCLRTRRADGRAAGASDMSPRTYRFQRRGGRTGAPGCPRAITVTASARGREGLWGAQDPNGPALFAASVLPPRSDATCGDVDMPEETCDAARIRARGCRSRPFEGVFGGRAARLSFRTSAHRGPPRPLRAPVRARPRAPPHMSPRTSRLSRRAQRARRSGARHLSSRPSTKRGEQRAQPHDVVENNVYSPKCQQAHAGRDPHWIAPAHIRLVHSLYRRTS